MNYMKERIMKEYKYLILNKELVYKLDSDSALLLTYLIEKHKNYTYKTGNYNLGFTQTVPQIKKALGLKRRKQERIIDDLIEKGLINKEIILYSGNKIRKFFINTNNILDFCSIPQQAGYAKDIFLKSGGYWILPHEILDKLSSASILFLVNLIEAEFSMDFCQEQPVIQTVNDVEKSIKLNSYYQSKAIEELIQWSIITKGLKKIGFNKKRICTLNYQSLITLFDRGV